MASLSDSKAHFLARAKEYEVPDDLINNMRLAGVSTLGHLAFAFLRPGQDFEERQFNEWATAVNLGNAPSMGALASLRRLHFEAEIVLTATLKASVEQPQDLSTPRPMPHAERSARLEQIKRQFPGLSMDGMHEPSQALLDECTHQYDARAIRDIEPAKCNSREMEVAMDKSDRKLRIESNSLTVKESKSTPEEDVSTAYKLQMCLKRRAIAYEFSGLLSFEVHEKYIDKLMRRLNTLQWSFSSRLPRWLYFKFSGASSARRVFLPGVWYISSSQSITASVFLGTTPWEVGAKGVEDWPWWPWSVFTGPPWLFFKVPVYPLWAWRSFWRWLWIHAAFSCLILSSLSSSHHLIILATSLSQILKADREVWIYMAQHVSDVRPRADGSRPLDAALHEALADYNVTFHLLPLPAPSNSSYAPVRNRDDAPTRESNYKGFQQGRKGKGKNKGQGQGSSVAPRGVKGAVGRDSKGRAICFNYNLSECQDAPAGGACKRGRHVCFKANCFKPHPFATAHAEELPKPN